MKEPFMTRIFALTMFSLLLFNLPLASADEGIIAITNPTVSVYEPGQKAIIAWNGEEEILILSTDVNASEDTLALRILPLPSNPKAIEKANFTSFIALEEILRRRAKIVMSLNTSVELPYEGYTPNSVVVTFHEKIGVHNITVVKADDAKELTHWINEFLVKNGIAQEISPQEFKDVVEDYMSRGFLFFVLDLIDISSQETSVEPILYRFETNFLYYPLRISSLTSGNTKITLFLLTQDKVGGYIYAFKVEPYDTLGRPMLVSIDWYNYTATAPEFYNISLVKRLWIGVPPYFNLTADELEQIDPRVKDLLGDKALLTVLQYDGPIGLFMGDLTLRYNETMIGYPFIPLPPVVLPSNQTTFNNLTTIPIDYQPPAIDFVQYSLFIEETEGTAIIQCHVEDKLSDVEKVILFYRFTDEEWNSIEMENVGGNFTAIIPLSTFKNIDFYIKALDKAGNTAVDNNSKLYYQIDVGSHLFTIILRNIGITTTCIVAAISTAFIASTYVKKRLNRNCD